MTDEYVLVNYCPFCGDTDLETIRERDTSRLTEDAPFYYDYFKVRCKLCGAKGPIASDPFTAVKCWSYRRPEVKHERR